MDPKNIRVAVFSGLCLLSSCAMNRGAKPTVAHSTTTTALPGENPHESLPPPPVAAKDLPAETQATPAQPPETPTPPPASPPKQFGVWIDGAGLDAIAALGFLQELERAGLKPAKVVGTGFGCWIAVSWALENSGNRAEWQAYKWSNWDSLPRGGILSKFTKNNARKGFEDEVSRLLSARRFDNLALPADCPLVQSEHPAHLVSARREDLATVLWYQFKTPALGVDRLDGEYISGLVAGAPLPMDLEAMSRDISRDKGAFSGWIILRTRNSMDRAGTKGWSEYLADRADQAVSPIGSLPDGSTWLVVNLSSSSRQTSDVQKFEKRREWLLEGRRQGEQLIRRSETRNFFQ